MTAFKLGHRPNRLVLVAAGALVVAVVMAMVFAPSEYARAMLYTVAFWVALLALVVAAIVHLRQRHLRPTVAPVTRLGRWSLGLVLAAVVILMGMRALIPLVAGPDAGPGVPIFVFSVAAIGCLVASGVTAVIAWFRRDERSIPVLLTVLPGLFAAYFVVGEFVFPH